MGFISTALGKSLFTNDSYKGAIGNQVGDDYNPGYSVIVLQPSIPRAYQKTPIEPIVIGIIKDKLDLKYHATWTEMGGLATIVQSVPVVGQVISNGLDAVGGFANAISKYSGGAELGAVYSSRKIYSKSGYLNISPSFRVVDWQGNADPLKAAFLIASYCSPGQGTNLLDLIKQWLQKLSDSAQTPGENIQKLGILLQQSIGLSQDAVINIKQTLESVGGVQTKVAFNNLMADIENDYLTIRSAPVPLQISVGQYFYHPDMVLEDATISFSREMTREGGPLYVDISLELSSRKIISGPQDIGFDYKFKANRLITNSNANQNQSTLSFTR